MAKINGIELKALKSFLDHEGAPCMQGNVYYKGKKLGFWSQDSWGGCDIMDFDASILQPEVLRFQAGYPDTYKYKTLLDDPSMLFYEILTLKELEKQVKKGIKAGFQVFVSLLTDWEITTFFVKKDDTDENILKLCEQQIQAHLDRHKTRNHVIHIFRSLNGLNLTIDEDHPAPDYLMRK